jgi:outer membrane protein OmpU
MKKILIATTMLVGTAGFAAAEVTLSGSARMGIVYDSEALNEMSFSSRARVNFGLSGESDNGLSFGASFRADNAGAANNGQAGSVFISGAFGRLSMGDVSSAAENAIGDLAEVGYTGVSSNWVVINTGTALDDQPLGNEMVYIATGDNEMALYEYSTGAFTLFASIGQPGDGQNSYSLAGRYATDTFTVALGYEDLEDVGSHVIGSASTTFSGVTLELIYGTFDGDGVAAGIDVDQYGLGASYTVDALTIDAYYRATDVDVLGATFANIDSYGIGATYDLGGGAALEGGITALKEEGFGTQTQADLGVTFTF